MRPLFIYALDGSEAAPEQDLTHLAGYGDAKPVRVGNAAREQIQLDIYGELFDSIYLANKYGTAMSRESWQHAVATADFVARHWRDPDAGIWEVRGVPREYLHSRLMCWVALDRASRLARKRSLSAPIERWTAERDRIADDIWKNFRHPEHGYFVQSRGSTELDAALLMMPLVRFVSASDPVWLLTLDAIRDQLSHEGLVFRYRNDDSLQGGEGAFTTCTFWYIECLARAGRLDEARLAMAKGLRYANHLGLFSEELSLLAERLRQTVGQVFRYGIVTGRAKRDPSIDLKGALKASGRQAHHKAMPREDLPEFLRALSAYDGAARTRLGLRLAVLTFVRTTELRAARWDEVDLEAAEWRIPAERMKMRAPHIVPLSRQAVETFAELRSIAGRSNYVFPSPDAEGFMSNNTMLFAMYRMGFHGRATVHGFRAVASTLLNEMGFHPDWIERQLAHDERNKVRGAYNHAQYLPERRPMMQQWADYLDDLAEGGKVIVHQFGRTAI